MIIIINGCFSSGKSTVAKRLRQRIDGFGYVDPDLFAFFRPTKPAASFPVYEFTWDLIEKVLQHTEDSGVNALTEIVFASGITSTHKDDYFDRISRVTKMNRVYTLLPTIARIKKQNKERNDGSYPEHILEKCFEKVKTENIPGNNVINISDSDSVDEIANRIIEDLESDSEIRKYIHRA